jgi:hypothetical protein
MLDRILSVLVALSLALLVWLYARSRDQEILDNVPIPVHVALASSQSEHSSLEVNSNSQVVVSFSGPPARIRELRGMVQRGELHVDYTLTIAEERLHESRYSDTIHIMASDIHAPPGVSPIIVEGRNRIPITVHRLVERRLPVRFDYLDEPLAGPIDLDPNTVLVRGPQEVLDRVRSIPTIPSLLPTRSPGSPLGTPPTARVSLVQELEGRPIRVTPSKVSVRLPAQVFKKYELADVPIQFLCPPNFQLRPQLLDERAGRISMSLQGPQQEEPPRVIAYVDLTRGRFTSGLNHEPLQVQLPRDFSLGQDLPRIAFELVPADFVPKGMGMTNP